MIGSLAGDTPLTRSISSDFPAAGENTSLFQGDECASFKSDWRVSAYPDLIGKLPSTEMLVIPLFCKAYLGE